MNRLLSYTILLILIGWTSCAFAHDIHEAFIPNKGQMDASVLYEKQLESGSLFIEKGKLRFVYYDESEWKKMVKHPKLNPNEKIPKALHMHAVVMDLKGADFSKIDERNPAIGYLNFYLGDKQERWATGVKGFGELYIHDVWPKIDLQIISQGKSFKYNFILNIGAELNQIQLHYDGMDNIYLKDNKNIYISTSVNRYTEELPLAYITSETGSVAVPCSYSLKNNTITFSVNNYSNQQKLILDPILVFSTYSGSTVDNFGFTATYDSKGCLYAGGIASRPTLFPAGRYPTTVGAFQYSYGGGDAGGWEGFPCDISISKYTPNGDSLVWASYLGGSKNEYPHSIIVDQNDQLVVFGTTTSTNFPRTTYGFDTTYNGGFDMIATKFSFDATSLVGSTYIGGSANDGFNIGGPLKYNYADEFRGEVDIDNDGSIYIASSTRSQNFPVSSFAPQKKLNDSLDAVMLKFDSTLSKMIWGSYWGDTGDDAFYSVEILNDTLVYLGGSTTSRGMRTDTTAIHPNYIGGRADGYIACFTNDSLKFVKGTYIGTPEYNQVYFIEQDIKGKIYATGQTDGVFPIVGNVFSQPQSGQFIIKITNDLSQVILSTTFGTGNQTADLNPSAFMIDYCENVYFSGWGSDVANPTDHVGTTNGLTVSGNAVQSTTDGNDFYLIVFSKNLQNIAYATYFGSPGQKGEFNDHVDGGTSRFDPRGVIYQSVCSSCPGGNLNQISNFPTTLNAYSKANPSPRCSNASFKIDFQITNAVMADFSVQPKVQCFPGNLNIQNRSIGGKKFYWDFGDGTTDTAKNPIHIYINAGEYRIRLIAEDSNSCNVTDTTYRSVFFLESAKADFKVERDTCSYKVKVVNTSKFIKSSKFYWGDGTFDSAVQAEHIYTTKGNYTIKLVLNEGTGCIDSLEQNVYISVDSNIKAAFTRSPIEGCKPLKVLFTNSSTPHGNYLWSFGDGATDTAENPSHNYLDSGVFKIRLLVTDITGCGFKDSAFATVRVLDKSIANFTVENQVCQILVIFTNLSPGGRPYHWSFGDGQTDTVTSPKYTYPKPGKYTIKLVTGYGSICPDSLEKTIDLKLDTSGELVFPNVFTPDGDGINETFKPGGVQSGCDNFKMYIYNLWGELLFVTEDINNGWTGKKENGQLHPTGTYYWLIEVGKGGGAPVKTKGHVLLLRKNE